MSYTELTTWCRHARKSAGRVRMESAKGAAILILASCLAGCITVNAPDEPIVIELNINIKQEVIYRLAADVRDNIEANPDIF